MDNKLNTNKSFKILVTLLSVVVLASFIYIYKVSDRSKKMIISLRKEKLELEEEKQKILKDLEKSDMYLGQLTADKNKLSNQLLSERQNVKRLIVQIRNLKQSDINDNVIETFKRNATIADDRIFELLKELDNYKKKIDSTNIILENVKITNDTLVTTTKKLSDKLVDASKLYYYNLVVNTYKIKSSGKLVETDNASRIDMIDVNFMIAENALVKTAKKDLFIQIIDPKNNVIGDRKIENLGNSSITYSSSFKVKYNSKTLKVENKIPVKELEEGHYFINIFDKSKIILKSSFELN